MASALALAAAAAAAAPHARFELLQPLRPVRRRAEAIQLRRRQPGEAARVQREDLRERFELGARQVQAVVDQVQAFIAHRDARPVAWLQHSAIEIQPDQGAGAGAGPAAAGEPGACRARAHLAPARQHRGRHAEQCCPGDVWRCRAPAHAR